ncbi:MAG TPA: isoprenylcysteine carboxylmethyltransferase family protein [Tianweitania sediminis]|jgi:protein-S-isoprenylcysteine O-methyltransferase Ste14|nr:isoprenylcysteine carboxylmethyltransferase family protein [Tianweitania sediminis]
MSDARSAPMRSPLPVLVLAAVLALSFAGHALLPLPWIGRPLADVLFMLGAIVVLCGLALVGATARQFRRENTTIRPDRAAQHLVTDGVFKISRNPIYLGMAMLMFGLGFLIGSLWFFIFGLIACLILQAVAIKPEERHLDAVFGKRYRDYRKKVRRWI